MTTNRANGKTILVVEDEGIVARQLQLSLSDLGYDVPHTAASAEEALRCAMEAPPDLILMDIHLEGAMDGIDAAALLRRKFDAAVVYLTAYADVATVERAKVTKPYGYLVKPVDDADLRVMVEVALYKREADREVVLSEAKFSGIVSISADAIISIDQAQRITMFNEGAVKLFGYSREEAMGAPLGMLLPERFRDAHREHVDGFAAGLAVARRMGEREASIYGRRKNGEEFPADAAISKIEVGGQRILTVALRDVSEQKRRESEQRLLAELGSVMLSTREYDETLTRVAEMAARNLADVCIVDVLEGGGEVRRLRVVSRDPSGASLCELLTRTPPNGEYARLFQSVIEKKRVELVEEVTPEALASLFQNEEHRRALRSVHPRSIIALPLLARGELLGIMALIGSTSSRAYVAADLGLAQQFAERAALSIERARLYHVAQRAIRARDDVLGIVAHDLRSPLNTIALQAAVLREERKEPGARDPAGLIERAVARMSRLIQDLLDVTRIDAGRLSVEQVRVSVAQLLSDSVEGQRALASSASMELRLDVAEDAREVWGDRERLVQVFENLIGNAVKFAAPGGRIVVAAAPRLGEVLFSVIDTGAGIATEDLPHLFDRFWQARRAERRGAGLGLPIAKGIVEAHGGRIWVESRVGGGSTFFFTIPTPPRAEASEGRRTLQSGSR